MDEIGHNTYKITGMLRSIIFSKYADAGFGTGKADNDPGVLKVDFASVKVTDVVHFKTEIRNLFLDHNQREEKEDGV